MAFNGSGVFNRLFSWVQDAANGLFISSTRMDAEMDGMADGLSNCITRDGQSPALANIPMGGFKLTGLGLGTARTDAASLATIQNGSATYAGTTGGAANAYTAATNPAITAYAAGQVFNVIVHAANTGASTIAFNGLAAKAITKMGAMALTGGEMPINSIATLVYDGTEFQLASVSAVAPVTAYTFLQNATFVVSAAANALTFALKGADGNDPSASNPIVIPFRSATATSGDYDSLTIGAALSLVVSSGSTLGATNAVASKFWLVIFNDGGTPRLGVINCRNGLSTFPLSACSVASSTAEGGAGAADSAFTFYTGTAVTSKAFRVIGWVEYNTPLATAGTYSAAPDKACLLAQDSRLPGLVIQQVRAQSGAVTSGATTLPYDDTIPQNTEGNAWAAMDCTVTPICAANLLISRASAFGGCSSSAGSIGLVLFQDSTANALAGNVVEMQGADDAYFLATNFAMVAGTVAATTFKLRYGSRSGATVTMNGVSAARIFGGVANAFHEVVEIAA